MAGHQTGLIAASTRLANGGSGTVTAVNRYGDSGDNCDTNLLVKENQVWTSPSSPPPKNKTIKCQIINTGKTNKQKKSYKLGTDHGMMNARPVTNAMERKHSSGLWWGDKDQPSSLTYNTDTTHIHKEYKGLLLCSPIPRFSFLDFILPCLRRRFQGSLCFSLPHDNGVPSL